MPKSGTIIWLFLALLLVAGAHGSARYWLGWPVPWAVLASAGALVLIGAGRSWRRRRALRRIQALRDSALW